MMTLEDFARACYLTDLLLRKATIDLYAERCPGKETAPNHLAWMLDQAVVYVAGGKPEKGHRWLGFVQGVMAANHYASIAELKLANMPEGETFDPGKA